MGSNEFQSSKSYSARIEANPDRPEVDVDDPPKLLDVAAELAPPPPAELVEVDDEDDNPEPAEAAAADPEELHDVEVEADAGLMG